MASIDEIFERLINDQAFRQQVADDPQSALAGYDLSEEDLRSLAEKFVRGSGDTGKVEERTSKSALISMISSLLGPSGGQSSIKWGSGEATQYSEFADPTGGETGDSVASYNLTNAWPKKGIGAEEDLSLKGFDPQPDPPGLAAEQGVEEAWPKSLEIGSLKAGDTNVLSDLEAKGFNPQPDPPGAEASPNTSDLESRGFSAQPELPDAEATGPKVAQYEVSGLKAEQDVIEHKLEEDDLGGDFKVEG